MTYYNPEHYPDPTVYQALKHLAVRDAAQQRKNQPKRRLPLPPAPAPAPHHLRHELAPADAFDEGA